MLPPDSFERSPAAAVCSLEKATIICGQRWVESKTMMYNVWVPLDRKKDRRLYSPSSPFLCVWFHEKCCVPPTPSALPARHPALPAPLERFPASARQRALKVFRSLVHDLCSADITYHALCRRLVPRGHDSCRRISGFKAVSTDF